MARKSYPRSYELAQKFTDTIKSYSGFKLLSEPKATVCHISIDGEEYYLFFKCVSPEGGPHPIEHQRSQLPQRPEFDSVKASNIPFLFLGYDLENDVYVCWEPHKVKNRLNKKSYVSFYSRLSIQQSVKEGEIREECLSNGDKFVLFKRQDIISFFQMITQHFPEMQNEKEDDTPMQENGNKPKEDVLGKLSNVHNDASVKMLIDSMDDSSKLSIVSACMNQFGDYYVKMSLNEWFKIVSTYLDSKENI